MSSLLICDFLNNKMHVLQFMIDRVLNIAMLLHGQRSFAVSGSILIQVGDYVLTTYIIGYCSVRVRACVCVCRRCQA